MDRIQFKINGIDYSVGSEITSDVSLVDYIRNTLGLHGTKYMCRQGGCGACIVSVARNPGEPHVAVNSCLVSITSCHNWDITTIEQLGNRQKGYHELQKALASYNGSQCGYCSPGWVMFMYSLLQTKKDLTKLEIEKSLSSNVCRCTGYRSILDAFKSFAKDASPQVTIPDIEDLKICKKTGEDCKKICSDDEDEWCFVSKNDIEEPNLTVILLRDGRKWYRANSINEVLSVLQKEGTHSYKLVAGNSAKGAYPILEYPQTLIDISAISELKGYLIDQNLIIGSGNTLSDLLTIYDNMKNKIGFEYLREFYDHLSMVANTSVRNIGTIAGNLMLKYYHNEFSSDLFLMFQTVGAEMTLINNNRQVVSATMQQFLKFDMNGSLIVNVKLPPLGDNCRVKTLRVAAKSQNAHAIVNFGALYQFSSKGDTLIRCRLTFGGLSPTFTRAIATETYIIGKLLFSNSVLQATLKVLENELVVTEIPPEPSAAYRKALAIGLFYKSLLSLCPRNILSNYYSSGAIKFGDTRPVSQGKHTYQTKPPLWPITQPIPKIEGLIQCAGEAFYTEDLPRYPNEVFAELVLSAVPKGFIVSIDATKALEYPGVIAMYTAKDIPGLNSFTPADDIQYITNEEVFCSSEVKYYNQPIGVIVAKSRHIADVASKLVDVTYRNVTKPAVDLKVTKNEPNRIHFYKEINAKDKGNDIHTIIKGSNIIYGQYHFTLETIACVTHTTEEGLKVYLTSQWPSATQTMIARALKMDGNRIDVQVRRVGGGFGIKISRSILTAVACSLVTKKLNLPCRMIHSLSTLTRAFGKRFPCANDYEFAVDKNGVIQTGIQVTYEDNGFNINEQLAEFGVNGFNNCYESSRWNYKCYNATTDTAKNTWCRTPGSLEATAMMEFIMEHISYALSLDPIQVRLANLDPQYSEIKVMMQSLIETSDYNNRRMFVNNYNLANRWKKRGLRFVPLRWAHVYPRNFDVNMSVFYVDGTIAITHGGVEIGQGLNTKAIQICAHLLQIPVDKIQIKPTDTVSSPNAFVTGGSLTTQNIGIGVKKCCLELLKRLEPLRKEMNNPPWPDLIMKAYKEGIDLQVHAYVSKEDMQDYNIYGVAFAEVEIDVLTGELQVLRVDVMQDAGQSISPELDIGQIEGALIMGQGYWTTENLVYNQNTGRLLTDSTWNYYVPQARDIPQDMRVHLRPNSYSTPPIFGSKMIGEPPACLAVVIPLAIREAITAARRDSGIPTTSWFPFDGPMTVERIRMLTLTRMEELKYQQ